MGDVLEGEGVKASKNISIQFEHGDERRFISCEKICELSRVPCVGEDIGLADGYCDGTVRGVMWFPDGDSDYCAIVAIDTGEANLSPSQLDSAVAYLKEHGWSVEIGQSETEE